MEGHATYTLLVLSKHLSRFAHANIPEADHFIVRTRNNLGFIGLGEDGLDSVLMTRKAVDLSFGSHVPNSDSRVSTSRDKDIKGWVESAGIDSTQMSMVLAHYLVDFKIPTLELFVFTT
jgi:hypothetical protein